MKIAIGTFLRAIGMVWIVGASLRLLFAVSSGGYRQGQNILIAILALALSFAVFWLGTWLKKNANKQLTATAISSVRRSWWSASLLFRAYVFLSVAWIVGALHFDDGYRTNWSLVVGPPIALLILYLTFKKFVLGSSDAPATEPVSPVTPHQQPSPVEHDVPESVGRVT